MNYEVVNLEQGSPEWLEFRKGRIGGSDASTIMGENPWKTPQQLYEEKKGLKEVYINDAMKRGTRLEPDARSMYERVFETMIDPAVVVDSKYPFLMASLDGFNKSTILEIKCPGEKAHDKIKTMGIPQHYVAQLQHAMMITGYKTSLFMSYRDDEDFVFYTCDRDDAYIEKLLDKELEFYDWLQNGLSPPKVEEDTVSDTEAELLAFYLEAQKKKTIWENTCKELREEIISTFNRPIKSKGVSLKERILPGRIDYDIIPELQNVDLEKYRKPETKSWVLSAYGK